MDYARYSSQLNKLGQCYWQEGLQIFGDYTKAVVDLSQKGVNSDRLQQFAKNESMDFTQRFYQCSIDYYMGVINAGLGLSQKKSASEANEPANNLG